MTSKYMLRRIEREENAKRNEGRKFLEDFEYTLHMAEARALSKFSLENPLNEAQTDRFLELGKLIGVAV